MMSDITSVLERCGTYVIVQNYDEQGVQIHQTLLSDPDHYINHVVLEWMRLTWQLGPIRRLELSSFSTRSQCLEMMRA